MNSQQLGEFFIPEDLIRNNPEIVAEAFKDMQFVAVRAEAIFIGKELEYAGISAKFEKIKKGTRIPRYRVDIFMNKAEGEEPEYSHVEITPFSSKPQTSDEVSGD